MTPLDRPRLRRACAILAAVASIWAFAVFVTGGFVLDFGAIRMSSRTPRNPLLIAAFGLVGAWVLTPAHLRRDVFRARWPLMPALDAFVTRASARGLLLATVVAAILAAATAATGILTGAHVVGGADSYGYVSQAHLWATGTLHVEQPLVDTLPEGIPDETLAPLGYRLDPDRAALVPVYAPGLPMLMSVFERAWGSEAVFYAMPILGGVAVWGTFVLGRMLAGPLVGALSATLLAVSPAFVLQLTHAPMSDIAAAAWWTCVLVLTPRVSRVSALGAGLAAGAAILTRPNLVPLAIVPGVLLLLETRGTRVGRRVAVHRLLLFAAGAIPACVIVAVLNEYWYGSPLESGYGPLAGTLYRWEYWWPNVQFYVRWGAATQTPLVFLAMVAPFVLWRRLRRQPDRRVIVLGMCTAFGLMTYACYAFYMPFEPWWSIRFLLPAFPVGFVLMTAAVVALCSRLPTHGRWLVPIVLVAAVGAHSVRFGRANAAYNSAAEWRYAVIGRYVADHMPARAAFLTMLHSGSVRHYSGRLTVRFDAIPADRLDAMLSYLRGAGYMPFILVDDVEAPDFVEHFSKRSPIGRLDWQPLADVDGVKIYAVDGSSRP